MNGLGKTIKILRKKQGLTILDITEKTGIDKATLSRIENDKMRGTVNAHLKIAEALGVRLPDLYEDVLSEQNFSEEKLTKDKLETFSHSSGAIAELLTTGALQKKMLPIALTIRSHGQTEREEFPVGAERFVHVMKGSLTIIFSDNAVTLKKGESLYFNGARPHHFENRSKSEVRCLSVVTPVSL